MKDKSKSSKAEPAQAVAGQSFSNRLHRRPFYPVPRTAYIHVGPLGDDARNGEPEEAVRQWCAFELMRAYGFSVTDLSFEAQVQVGSKFYRIDILVLRNGLPWIVVECKAPEAVNDKAIDQAISYADSPRVHAEYVLYTNGSDWQVRRRFRGQWQPVLDLPCARFEQDESIGIAHFYACLNDAAPLLYKLDETIQGKEAECFLHALQRFFHGWNLLTDGVDQDLTSCADNLLRVLSLPNHDYAYRCGKYNDARAEFCRFQSRHKIAWEVPPIGGEVPIHTGFLELQSAVLQAIDGTSRSAGPNVLALRLIAALLEYGIATERCNTPFATMPGAIHHSLREFLQYQFRIKFDAMLPDPVDQITGSDFRLYCGSAWESALRGVQGL